MMFGIAKRTIGHQSYPQSNHTHAIPFAIRTHSSLILVRMQDIRRTMMTQYHHRCWQQQQHLQRLVEKTVNMMPRWMMPRLMLLLLLLRRIGWWRRHCWLRRLVSCSDEWAIRVREGGRCPIGERGIDGSLE